LTPAAAAVQRDDRMALEFSAPSALYGRADDNAQVWRTIARTALLPDAVGAISGAAAHSWRNRAAMIAGAHAYEQAFDGFAAALAQAPDDLAAGDGLIQAAVALDRITVAQSLVDAAVSRHSTSALWITRSKLAAAAGAMHEAVASAERAVALEPTNPLTIEHLASIHADAGDADRLERAADQLDRAFPDRPSAAYYAASAAFLQGRLHDALRLAGTAIDRDASSARAHNLAGAVLATLERPVPAREAFHAALRLDPRDPSVYVNLGWLELSAGNVVAASGYFAEALALDPSSVPARTGLARVK
jgi:Flp pilus assembly protein TadD